MKYVEYPKEYTKKLLKLVFEVVKIDIQNAYTKNHYFHLLAKR